MKRKYQQAVQLELFATPLAPAGTPAPSAPARKPAQSPQKPRREPVQLDLFAPPVVPTSIKAPSVKLDMPAEPEAGVDAGAALPYNGGRYEKSAATAPRLGQRSSEK